MVKRLLQVKPAVSVLFSLGFRLELILALIFRLLQAGLGGGDALGPQDQTWLASLGPSSYSPAEVLCYFNTRESQPRTQARASIPTLVP